MKMLERKEYLEKIINAKDINLVKVITGVRRSGKSTLLVQYKDYLIKNINKDDEIIYISFESLKWKDIKDYMDLYQYITKTECKGKKYILLDEIQSVKDWEKCINSLLIDINCDIYITGSNAYMLSSELTTLLAGRVFTISIYPFSFSEYIKIYPFEKNENNEDKFLQYLRFGGMPMITTLKNDETLLTNYLKDVRDVIIKNDVIARNNIKDIPLLDNLMLYMASVIGQLTNPTAIAEYINKSGSNVRHETIDAYLKMLENAFVIYRTPRYKLEGKQLLKTQGKYYYVDNGIKNAIGGFSSYDSGSSLENIVYIELLRRGYEVYVGVYKSLEIDFIAIKPNEKLYIQVSRSIQNEEVEEREKKSLLSIKDNNPKYILTMDRVKDKIIDGIKVINVIDFLLE